MLKTILTASALALSLGSFTALSVGEASAAGSQATTIQKGKGNKSGIKQKKKGNSATVMQFGDNHESDVDQSGGDNLAGVLQLGNGSKCKVKQSGGEVGFCLGLD